MFNRGDIVRAITRPDGLEYHFYTNSKVLCKVVWVEGKHMGIKILGGENVFRVSCSLFRLEHVELENK